MQAACLPEEQRLLPPCGRSSSRIQFGELCRCIGRNLALISINVSVFAVSLHLVILITHECSALCKARSVLHLEAVSLVANARTIMSNHIASFTRHVHGQHSFASQFFCKAKGGGSGCSVARFFGMGGLGLKCIGV